MGDIDPYRDVLEHRRSVEKASVDSSPAFVVVVLDPIPETGGISVGHLHDLVCISVANVVGLHISPRLGHLPLNREALTGVSDTPLLRN